MKEIFSRTADGHEIACGWTLSHGFLKKVKDTVQKKRGGYIGDISLITIESFLLAAEKVLGDLRMDNYDKAEFIRREEERKDNRDSHCRLVSCHPRNVISLSTTWLENNSTTQCSWITTALCVDGTMWLLRQGDSEWYQLPPIGENSNGKT